MILQVTKRHGRSVIQLANCFHKFTSVRQFFMGLAQSQDMDSKEAVRAMIDTKIAGKKVMVFSKSTCGFCAKAKRVLSEYQLSPDEYEVMEIERNPNCSTIQDILLEITGGRSVPRVFIDGKCIGGGDETSRFHSKGQLEKMGLKLKSKE